MSCILITIRFMSSFKWNPNKNNNMYSDLFNISRHFNISMGKTLTRRKIEIECVVWKDIQTHFYFLHVALSLVLCQCLTRGNKWLIWILNDFPVKKSKRKINLYNNHNCYCESMHNGGDIFSFFINEVLKYFAFVAFLLFFVLCLI